MVKKLLLLGFILIVSFWHDMQRLPQDGDELRYLEVTREMAETRSWFVPSYNYKPYAEKPPLYFWLLALSKKVFPHNPTKQGLALTGVATLGLLVVFCLWLYREGAQAFPSVFALASLFLFSFMGRVIRMDMLLALWVVMGLADLYRASKTHRLPYLWGLALGLGMLTKGPVIFLWLALFPWLYALIRRDRSLRQALSHPALYGLGLGIFALWLIPALMLGTPAYQKALLWSQTAERITGSLGHPQGWSYYLAVLPLACFPFTPLVLAGMVKAWKGKRDLDLFCLAWVWIPLVLFSLQGSKMVIYLLPAMPASAYLAVLGLEVKTHKLWMGLASLMLASIGGGLALVARDYPTLSMGIWFFPFVLGLILLLVSLWHPRLAFYGLSIGMVLWMGIWGERDIGRLIAKDNTAVIADAYRLRYPELSPYATYRELRPSFLWTLHQPIRVIQDREELQAIINSPQRFPFLINQKRLTALPLDMQQRLRIVEEQPIRKDSWMIVSPLPSWMEEIANQE